MNCSALQEQTEGSGPSTNQVSLLKNRFRHILKIFSLCITPLSRNLGQEISTLLGFQTLAKSGVAGWSRPRRPFKNSINYIDVSHSRQPLVKGERLVRCERKTVTIKMLFWQDLRKSKKLVTPLFWYCARFEGRRANLLCLVRAAAIGGSVANGVVIKGHSVQYNCQLESLGLSSKQGQYASSCLQIITECVRD